jgi:hypothetical protein
MPERANALLRRMDNGLQQKLTTAVAQYAAGVNLLTGERKRPCKHMYQMLLCLFRHMQTVKQWGQAPHSTASW